LEKFDFVRILDTLFREAQHPCAQRRAFYSDDHINTSIFYQYETTCSGKLQLLHNAKKVYSNC
jgi:hypothetical protein